ncbi:MAG: SpoIIE family protein phosphatase [SAR324 cluster bacterium]|nr:SpoIIE family protein phosphatase [SAR324 cluster bacterium]
MKILIIDGSRVARTFIKRELSSLPDAQFFEAENGEEGFNLVLRYVPDLITMGLIMKGNDNNSLIMKIRHTPELSHIPVIVITSNTDDEAINHAFDAGAAEIFFKPFPDGKLMNYVKTMFRKEQDLTNINILVADDSSTVRSIILRTLTSVGATTFGCVNGEEAVEILNRQPIDLIISDYIMPKKDGIEVCKYVRTVLNRDDIPFILLTAVGERSVVLDALNAGANDYLTKPFSREEIMARIKNHVRMIHFNRRLQLELAERKKRELAMIYELNQARETQKVLLPTKLPEIPGAKLAAKYVPMDQIGGDFYNIFPLEDNRFGIMIADVTGHGVPAALISFMVSGIFTNHALTVPSSTKLVMDLTNHYLHGKLRDDKFATMFYAIYDATEQSLLFTNAGHNIAYVFRGETDEHFELDTDGIFLGPFPNEITNYKEKEFQFNPGDRLLLYTDAIMEIADETGEMFGEARLLALVKSNKDTPLNELLDLIYDECLRFSGRDGMADDCTMVALEIL